MTGLPFVFALWAVREDAAGELGPDDMERFRRPLSLDADELRALAEREAPRLGLHPQEAFHYLHSNLHYRLGERERQALETFFRLAAEEGLAPAGVPLRAVEQAALEAHR
jgi:predicted solute-binding protein